MKAAERDAIEELARLLDGELSADEASAPIRELATLAATVTEVETVARPTPAFRAALRNELVADIGTAPAGPVERVRDAVWDRTARWRNSAKVAMASAVASTLLGTAGVAAAAQQALPGELLYGVKRATESVRLALADGLTEEGRVHLALAEERLEEIRTGVGGLSADEIVDGLDAMDTSSVAGADALLQAVRDGGPRSTLDALLAFTDRQRTGLAAVYDDLPAGARTFADRSFEVLRRIEVQTAVVLDPCAACEEAAGTATAPAGDTPSGSVAQPGEGPAAPERPACDCVGSDGPPPARDPGVVTAPPADDGDDGTRAGPRAHAGARGRGRPDGRAAAAGPAGPGRRGGR